MFALWYSSSDSSWSVGRPDRRLIHNFSILRRFLLFPPVYLPMFGNGGRVSNLINCASTRLRSSSWIHRGTQEGHIGHNPPGRFHIDFPYFDPTKASVGDFSFPFENPLARLDSSVYARTAPT